MKTATPDYTISLDLLKRDKHLAPLIKKYGAPDFSGYHGTMNVFTALLRSITYQQLSGKAAGAIFARFLALYPRKRPTPTLVLVTSDEALRTCGLSRGKIVYVKDLADKFHKAEIDHKRFPNMTSQEIIDHLRQVKGIGEWTAQMLLIFTLNRLDILPVGDLAIRKGFQQVYALKSMPNKKEMEKLAKKWREHASVASWYLWKAMDE